jgi:Tol biopolymer transport system component
VVGPNGGNAKQVVSGCVLAFAWSPNGKSLAVVRPNEIAVINPESGKSSRLAELKEGGVKDAQPAWSPDGSKLAFGTAGGEIFVASTSGRGKPKLVNRVPHQRGTVAAGYSPSWSPNGKRIAYDRLDPHGGHVAIVSPDGSGRQYLRRRRGTYGAVPVLWFPDGRHLLFRGAERFNRSTQQSQSTLEVVGSDGAGLRRIASVRHPAHSTYDAVYAISPDGRRVAYSLFGVFGIVTTPRIYVVRPNQAGIKYLATGTLGGWSPDGRRLVFTGAGLAGGVFVVNADGTGRREISPPAGEVFSAQWSRRGQIAFIRRTC